MAPMAFNPYSTEEEEQAPLMDIRSIDERVTEEEADTRTSTTIGRVIVAAVAIGAVVGVASQTSAGKSAATAAEAKLFGVGSGEGFCTTPSADDDQTTTYFKCPPGSYLNNTAETKKKKMERLVALQAKLKDMGYVENDRSAYKAEYSDRGYATYESPVWLKPEECSTLPDEDWTSEYNAWYYQYQPDHAPSYITKQVYSDYNFEFHDNWKVSERLESVATIRAGTRADTDTARPLRFTSRPRPTTMPPTLPASPTNPTYFTLRWPRPRSRATSRASTVPSTRFRSRRR